MGFAWRTTVMSLRTTAFGYKRRTRVVGLKWGKLVISGLLQVNNYSGRLQMENGGGFPRRLSVVNFRWRTTALGYRRRTTVVDFKWGTLVMSDLLQVNNYSGWVHGERQW